jgi:hypothetical protein
MIVPLVNQNGQQHGFVAGETVFDNKGRRIGQKSATSAHVISEAGTYVGEISGNVINLVASEHRFRNVLGGSVAAAVSWVRSIRLGGLRPITDL